MILYLIFYNDILVNKENDNNLLKIIILTFTIIIKKF